MIDDDLRRLIDGMREQEAAAIEEKKRFHTWTEADSVAVLDPNNPEVARLLRGDHSTLTPAERAEVERLAALSAEDTPQNQK
jgi:hypothetical protein